MFRIYSSPALLQLLLNVCSSSSVEASSQLLWRKHLCAGFLGVRRLAGALVLKIIISEYSQACHISFFVLAQNDFHFSL